MGSVFQERFREAMQESGLKQVDITERTGIDKAAVSSYLSGRYKPNAAKITKLAEALGVSPAWLNGQSENKSVRRPVTYEIPAPEIIAEPIPYMTGLTNLEMDLIEAWRKANDKEKRIVALTLVVKY